MTPEQKRIEELELLVTGLRGELDLASRAIITHEQENKRLHEHNASRSALSEVLERKIEKLNEDVAAARRLQRGQERANRLIIEGLKQKLMDYDKQRDYRKKLENVRFIAPDIGYLHACCKSIAEPMTEHMQ